MMSGKGIIERLDSANLQIIVTMIPILYYHQNFTI